MQEITQTEVECIFRALQGRCSRTPNTLIEYTESSARLNLHCIRIRAAVVRTPDTLIKYTLKSP